MIDHIVCHTQSPGLAKSLLENNSIDFGAKISQQTGDIFNNGRQDGQFHNLKIQIHHNYFIRLAGSLHTFYNALKDHVNIRGIPMNHDTFTPEKLQSVIGYLHSEFEIDPKDVSIHQIEFGVNLANLPFATEDIIDRLIVYNKYPFDRMKNIQGIGYGRESCLTQYRIKAYDKSLQNGLKDNIFRFEYSAKKMQSIFDKQIIYLSGLSDHNIWERLGERLLKAWDDCIFIDEIDIQKLSKSEQIQIKDFKNPRIWEGYSYKQRSYRKKQFNRLMSQHGQLQIKQQIRNAINHELDKMASALS
ncbi:hypothetical protein [Sphingobacterium sp. 1.A.4]|uniref:hypothetical protein n=1 Tax=Sphingobacterium sp. 1.A.4 TaxID=2044603 RepID=UPI000C0C055D|nr:hypothetical protein [Sphingobacterium sp. 1.A.4]